MKSEQIYCDRCGEILVDKTQGINKNRNSVLITIGASRNGVWGQRYDELNLKSDDGICDECFAGFVACAEILRDWSKSRDK